MAENCMEIGLVTYINGSQVYLWLMEAREEQLFVAMVKEDVLKVTELSYGDLGVWIHLSKTDLETSQIGCVMLVATPPVKASICSYTSGIEKAVLVETRIVFSPVEWAKKNDYEWFAYSFEFGRVGNFAFNKLLKLNSYQVRRDVVYKAVMIRIPSSELGQCVIDTFGSLWSILPQVLVLCDDQNGFDKRPWSLSSGYQPPIRSVSSKNVDELTSWDVWNNPSNEFAEGIFESLVSSNDCTSATVDSNLGRDHYEACSQQVYLGVVILREPQYSIIWGKVHGFVAVCATADLVLEPSNWVEYDCIETDTELGVSYLAIYCVLSKQKPLVVEAREKSIICHTVIHVPNERKAQADVGGTYFTMVCDILGNILVPDIPVVHRCIRKNKLKAKVLVKYDVNEKWPCTLFAVYENDMLKMIDWKQVSTECKIIPEMDRSLDLKDIQCESDKPQFLDDDANILRISALQKSFEKEMHDEKVFVEVRSSPCLDTNPLPITAEITHQCSSDNSSVASARNIKRVTECEEKPGPSGLSYTTASAVQKTLPVTILVKLTSTYGILWHINRKLIIVPGEYLGNSAKLGTWMKAKVSPLDTTTVDLPYHFIVMRPLEEIESKLMTQKIGDVLQVRVHLEPGVESYIDMNGKLYLQKNSELGLIYIPSEKIPQKYLMKKFRAWVTFISSELSSEPIWMVNHRQTLIDEDGNELPDESDI
ncbi:unnamed protein product [Cercopithifilaria johnstoni]|uniref:Uncharacterized protein n=1 Tax=Cercopithifilaria johnstoni TaxID=2874296 RepID=A0A8J2M3U4_9BILA|nr:unnamed protein product [Cercopithifilaria johnstoni]